MDSETKINHKILGFLASPSWFSGLVVVVIALTVVIGTIAANFYSGSDIRELYLEQKTAREVENPTNTYQLTTSQKLISSAPLVAFWSLVGLVVYLLAVNIVGAVQQANEIKNELNYVNADRNRLLKTAGLHFLARLVVVAVWIPYLLLFFNKIIPYVLTAATAGVLKNIEGIVAAVMGFTVMVVALHLHVVLLRLLMLKPRIFSRSLYVS